MKLNFTGDFADLKDKLSSLKGDWDESQPNKKVLRYLGAVLNWYETTGTLQVQGRPQQSMQVEKSVQHLLYPDEFDQPEEAHFDRENLEDINNVEEIVHQNKSTSMELLDDEFEDSEIVIGLVSAVGTEVSRIINPLKDRLSGFGYTVKDVRVSSLLPEPSPSITEYGRIKHYMIEGDKIRKSSNNHGILAYGAARLVSECRPSSSGKIAYIVNSLKHPDEVSSLRKIYGQGFYLIGVHSDKKRRMAYLTSDKGLKQTEASELVSIDEDEKIKHGQKTRDTFHLSDFYLNLGKNDDQVKNTIQRFLELIFSQPYKNPTFDEFAMYMAFSSSVRSGDLSRQVGAVISKNKQIIATGANEVPAAGGGHYWAEMNNETGEVYDIMDGKDYTRQQDSNKVAQNEIISSLQSSIKDIEGINSEILAEITSKLNDSPINDLTEFGRVVHAEMQAILSCAKEGIGCMDGTLYCTTFPCHNCAKHLIAAGIKRVVYVEPYAKSKALEFHNESITMENDSSELVLFEPFIGVGARRFLDFFSMNSGAGTKLKRKNKDGSTVTWKKETAKLRVVLSPESYLNLERCAIEVFKKIP